MKEVVSSLFRSSKSGGRRILRANEVVVAADSVAAGAVLLASHLDLAAV